MSFRPAEFGVSELQTLHYKKKKNLCCQMNAMNNET
jgi:hypothetical protein